MWRSCTTNFTQICKNKWKEQTEILILMFNVPCKTSNATNFSDTKKCLRGWLDNLMDRHLITFVSMAVNMPIFTKPSPARNLFSPAKNSCTKYPKNPTYRIVSNISQRQTAGRTDRKRENDGRILHKRVSFFCSGIISYLFLFLSLRRAS